MPKKRNTKKSPLKGIEHPHKQNAVLCGRGGLANSHPGNKRYRKMVENLKEEYVQSARAKKTSMSRDLVEQWRSQQPPGTFLKRDETSGLYYDIGDKKARRKTAQLFREKKKEQCSVEDSASNSYNDDDQQSTQSNISCSSRAGQGEPSLSLAAMPPLPPIPIAAELPAPRPLTFTDTSTTSSRNFSWGSNFSLIGKHGDRFDPADRSFAEMFNLKDIDDASFEAAIEEEFSPTTRATANSIGFPVSAEVNYSRDDNDGPTNEASHANVFELSTKDE